VNDYDFHLARAQQCAGERGKTPNYVAIYFYQNGDVFRMVDTLNGVGKGEEGLTGESAISYEIRGLSQYSVEDYARNRTRAPLARQESVQAPMQGRAIRVRDGGISINLLPDW
jgi:hypothetical protein